MGKVILLSDLLQLMSTHTEIVLRDENYIRSLLCVIKI